MPCQYADFPKRFRKPLCNDLPHAIVRPIPCSGFPYRDYERFVFFFHFLPFRSRRHEHFYIHSISISLPRVPSYKLGSRNRMTFKRGENIFF